jgi:hypothetical protein
MKAFRLLPQKLIVLVALASAPLSTRAALIAYDGFGYASVGSDLQGGNGGFGFAGPWQSGGFNASIFNNYDIAAGSLPYAGLATSGNSVRSGPVAAIAGLTRPFLAPIGVAGTTVYYSFLLRPEGTLGQGAFNGFFGLTLESAGEPEIFSGKPGGGQINNFVIEDRGGAAQFASTQTANLGQSVLLVVKAEFTVGLDQFTLYVNPAPGAPEPAFGTVKAGVNAGLFDGFTIYSTGEFGIDELRLGQTFADVVPVPEPRSIALLASGVLLAIFRYRTRGAR